MTPDIATRVRHASGFIFDMDGTIALGDAASGGHRALPGAIELLAAIRAKGVPLRVFTNGTAKPPATYAASLRDAGFDLHDHEMMTPSTSAAAWFVKQRITRVRVLGNAGVAAPLIDAGITCIGAAEPAEGVEAVYTGWFREFTFPDLEAACQSVWAGARLTTASHVPFFATANGRGIGASYAINAMITAMTGKRAKVLGKPSKIAFDAAADAMGIARTDRAAIVIVGDDPALEMRMAHNAGATGIGMTTGIMRPDAVAALKREEQPHAVIDHLQALLALI
ncbi:HAD hydrolase-like protein [Novosphingobium sp.]|uniref:HAD-IIA family hydrolase n=1 Tax=Novosphingobium sp. TaxID=1874826 RepID=UPI00333F8A30